MTEEPGSDTPSAKPSFQSRLLILLIGGTALAGIALMCFIVFAIMTLRS